MTSVPDWLVERAALDEVSAAHRERLERAERANPAELADRIAQLHAANAAELAHHPAAPAIAQIEARIAAARRRNRRRILGLVGIAASAAAVVAIAVVAQRAPADDGHVALNDDPPTGDGIRIKGEPRLLAFRQAGERAERLVQDAVVRAGDVVQLRYNAGGQPFGVIASVDGAGVVTLHYPLREDAPPEATALAAETTSLPAAYALDDAPRFERFFLITAPGPVDVQRTLDALRALARRGDSATALLELPDGMRQWTLRLRKPDRASP